MSESANELPSPAIRDDDKSSASTSKDSMNETPLKTSSLLLPTSPVEIKPPTAKSAGDVMSSGSATGNPRNKCALKPGHSLMDWIRLGNSGVDIAGTKGVIQSVSHAELARHNKQSDAWLAIRGKVYNVTAYMDFHPGGECYLPNLVLH